MISFVLIILLVVGTVTCRFHHQSYLKHIPMENPDLYGGDMLGVGDIQDRSATVDKNQLWPGGVVPYERGAGSINKLKMDEAINDFHKNTCIRFVPRTNETNYIRIFPGDGCYSHVGMTGGAQPLSLGVGCKWMGTIIHELNHALGFYHEQNRSDRDEYLIIYWENIKEDMADQFLKLKPEQNKLLTSFDFDSLMLYGSYSFSKDKMKGVKTMVGKQGQFLQTVRDKHRLSKDDIKRINMLYKCPS